MTTTPAMIADASDAAATWPCVDTSVDLLPTTEETDYREALRALLDAEGDIETLRELVDTAPGYSPRLWTELTESMAVTSIAVPEEAGGQGFGMTFLAAALEECGRTLRPEPVFGAAAVGAPALTLGTGDIVAAWRDSALSGELIVATSSLSAQDDRIGAVADDGTWTLTGTAFPVASAAAAGVVIVSAATGEGRALFAVDTADAEVRAHESIDPTRPLSTVAFEATPAQLLTASASDIAELRDRIRVALAAELVGITAHLLEITREYTLSRRQFGRQIASYQAIKHRLADMLLNVERARSLSRYAAAHFDRDPATATLPAAAAAAVAMDAAHLVAAETIQLHGGIGFTWEHPAHNYYRRVLADEATYGSAGDHRRSVARALGVWADQPE